MQTYWKKKKKIFKLTRRWRRKYSSVEALCLEGNLRANIVGRWHRDWDCNEMNCWLCNRDANFNISGIENVIFQLVSVPILFWRNHHIHVSGVYSISACVADIRVIHSYRGTLNLACRIFISSPMPQITFYYFTLYRTELCTHKVPIIYLLV